MADPIQGLDTFESRRSTVYAPSGAVATSQPLAAQAAIETLQSDGNAIDAAVTAAAVLNVVEPTSTGLGGDVFALYRTPDGTVEAMRSCGGAPSEATIPRVRSAVADDSDEGTPSMPFHGPHTVTVPGTARGWETLLDRSGRLSLASCLTPAIEYAREGYPVSPVIASHWTAAEDLFTDASARRAYLFDDRAPAPGQHVTLPQLAESMAAIADRGADVVYEGWIADEIVNTVQDAGGFLTHEDLESFSPEYVDPISATYRDSEVYQLPANNQGPIVLEALRIADAIDAGTTPYDSVERLYRFIEAMKLAFHDGHRHITDPTFEEIPPLTAPEWVADRADRIDGDPLPAAELPPPGPRGEETDTVLVTVADADGFVVSLINSRFAGFGSGLVAGDTGIALQNRGASFSLNPDHPNHLAPGKRPFHTLIPGLIRYDRNDWAAFGVMGGHMQPQGHLQVLANLLDYGMTPQGALDAPRWRYRADGTVSIEPRFPGPVQTGLVRRGYDVSIDEPTAFGGAQYVRWDGSTTHAATEPRKDGSAVGF